MNQQVPMVQTIGVDPKTTQHHPQSWVLWLHAPAHLALVAAQAGGSGHGPDIQINQYNYFDIIGSIPPIANHGIWGCLHCLPLVLNIFLACYDSGTVLSRLTDGGYGFDALGSPGINMYQMYIIAPMIKAGMTYIGVGLVYKPQACLLETSKDVPHFSGLSSMDVKVRSMQLLVRHISFKRGGVWVLSVAPCQLGSVLTPSFHAKV